MIKKSLIVTTLAAAGLGLAALPAEARHHNDDRAAGAIIGGTLGALIGSSVHGGDGALVGGLLGAVVGAGSVGSHGYYGGGYYTAALLRRPGALRHSALRQRLPACRQARCGRRWRSQPLRPRAAQPALALTRS